MSTTLLKNVRLFDPGAGVDADARNVVLDGAAIGSLDASAEVMADRVIDGGGKLLVPGLVDLRVHACEPGFTSRESIATAAAAAAAGGVTTFVALPTTKPTVDRVEVVELILARGRAAGTTRVLPAGALSVGREGERLAEMAKLSAAGCVLFTDGDRSVKDSQLLRYAMETAGDVGTPIMTHAEDESLSLGGVMHEGLVSARLGLSGAPGAAEVVGISRDLAIAELTGSRLHIGHVSTAAGVELIRQAKKRGIRVTADVSPLHLLLTDEAVLGYDTAAKVFPPLRPRSDVDAVITGLADGTIDCVASDHNPQIEIEKNVELDWAAPGATGLETMLPVMLALVSDKRLTLERAITTMTRAPANVLQRLDLGRLREGGPADLTLIDREVEWRFEQTYSKSRNTPLLGRRFVGRAALTIAQGVVTYEAPR
ncbi:MAG: dihydroorotase [Deltaproteobacteria bacterium]|jgi:dihydroorotase